MKACPTCNATFDDRIDFCFEDGSPLVAAADSPAAVDASGLDVPEAKSLGGTGADDVRASAGKKLRRPGRSGMFARPSVADMLAVPEPGLPPVGGRPERPDPTAMPEPTEVSQTEEESPETPPAAVELTAAPPAVEAVVAEAVEEAPVEPADPEDEVPTEIFDAPEAAFFGEGDALDEDEDLDSAAATDVPTPIALPMSGLAAAQEAGNVEDEPSTAAAEEDEPSAEDVPQAALPEVAGLDAPDAAGFFGDTDAPNDPLIEDPGFAEVGRVPAPEPVGFEDKPFFADGAVHPDGAGTRGWVVWGGGAVLVVAAGLLGIVMLGSTEEPKVPMRRPLPVAQTKAPVEVAPPAAVAAADAVMPAPGALGEEGLPLTGEDAVAMDDAADEGLAQEDGAGMVPVVPPMDAEVPPPPPEAPPEEETEAQKARREARELKRREARAQQLEAGKTAEEAQVEPTSTWAGPAAAEDDGTADAASPWGGTQEISRGRVTISTDPSKADVFVDGKRIGRSPTTTEVDYGTHSVRVELADHKTQSKSFNVQVPQYSLPFRMAPSTLSGKCNLLGPLGATVVMDGRMLGSLPRTVKCTSGPHRFRVTPTGGEGYTVVRTIEVTEPGESFTVSLGGI